MTGGACLGVLPPERFRIETRPVGIEAPAAQRGVAGEAITLGVTGYTGFETLACGLPVIEEEGRLRVVETDAAEPSGRDESRADMAAGAELALVVTVVAGAFPTVRRGRMGC